MKAAVMLSISPRWCSLIASGEKTIEVRKTRPKMEPPFKCYIYQTLPKYGDCNNRDGKVVGEFICSAIVSIYPPYQNMIAGACLSAKEANEYAQGRQLYCWCISKLMIYDKSKELREFIVPSDIGCCNQAMCYNCIHFDRGNGFNVEDDCNATFDTDGYEPLLRPPQSWRYVAERGSQNA